MIEMGEKNTKYFLNLEKQNYKNKCITKLINDKEEIIEDEKQILEYEAEFYKSLYSDPQLKEKNKDKSQAANDTFLDVNTPKIKEDDKQWCERNIDLEEIGKALKGLKNGKSPGTDGFTADFYKFFWIKIKILVLESLRNVYSDGELSTEQKRGIINLIPKKDKDTRLLQNW
jgi:hypothetical protein